MVKTEGLVVFDTDNFHQAGADLSVTRQAGEAVTINCAVKNHFDIKPAVCIHSPGVLAENNEIYIDATEPQTCYDCTVGLYQVSLAKMSI